MNIFFKFPERCYNVLTFVLVGNVIPIRIFGQTIPFESIIDIHLHKNHAISVTSKMNHNSRCMPSYPIHLVGIHNPQTFVQMAQDLKMKHVRNQYPSLESLLGQSEAIPPNWKRKE